MVGILGKILDSNEKEIARLSPMVEKINQLEPVFKKLSISQLKGKTAEFKLRAERGETLDDLLPESFAAVREAAWRTIGERHFDVQLLAGIVLHQGKVAEQKTGEGKTLSATTACYLNSLAGYGIHVATVNDYLARRDCGWVGPVYAALGVATAAIMHDAAFIFDPEFEDKAASDWRLKHLRPVSKKEAYEVAITYGTNTEFGFDYLRDNMVWDLPQEVQRGHHFAIVDEADSILIDEARTPLIISAPSGEATEKYYQFAKLIEELNPATDFVIDEKLKTANLTEHGILKVEKKLGVPNLYEKDFATIHHIEQALRAKTLFTRDKDYVVKDDQAIIVDEFTGRLLFGRRYSEGLHQAIEAKENLSIQQESKTLATVSFQNYFRLYQKLAGMTGTAATEGEEFHKIYGLDVVIIPTNEPMIRQDYSDVVYKTARVKFSAVAALVEQLNKKGQPVLLGTTSIEKNEFLSKLLTHKKISHQVLNAKNHQREAEIIAAAGNKGVVTLATNIAGRGVDIVLGGAAPKDGSGRPRVGSPEWTEWEKRHKEVVACGGLFVIGTERHEARRIDNQLRGRSGRQGDPGASRFFVCLEDDVMRLFGGEQVAKIMTALKLPEDTPIEHKMVSKAIESAQVKVETHNFDLRKHLVEYDDVVNKQREIIYGLRQRVLASGTDHPLKDEILEKIRSEISNLATYSAAAGFTSEEYDQIVKEFCTIVPFDPPSQEAIKGELQKLADSAKISEFLTGLAEKLYGDREEKFGPEVARQIERMVYLSVIDTLWMEHIDTLDHLRETIGLRGYGQREPLVEYKQEAFNLFERLMASIDYEIVRRIFKIQVQAAPAQAAQVEANQQQPASLQPAQAVSSANVSQTNPRAQEPNNLITKKKIGRNDPCPCGAIDPNIGRPYKYKKCGLVNAPYHKGGIAESS